jgi:hypothetical protein
LGSFSKQPAYQTLEGEKHDRFASNEEPKIEVLLRWNSNYTLLSLVRKTFLFGCQHPMAYMARSEMIYGQRIGTY